MQDTLEPVGSDHNEATAPAKPRVELRRVRDFGATVTVHFEFLRANFRVLLKSMLVIVGPALIVGTIISSIYAVRLFSQIQTFDEDAFRSMFEFYRGEWVIFAISILSGILTTVFLIAVIGGYARLYVERAPAPISVDDVWREVKSSVGRVTTTLLFTNIVALLPAAVLILPAALSASPVLIVLAAFASFIPTLYLYVCLAIAIPIRLEERIGLFASLRRSMQLMKRRWWFSFFTFLVMFIIVMLVASILQIPMQTAGAMSAISGEEASPALLAIGTVLSTIGSYVLYSMLILTCSILYYNLVEQKEGIGMIDRINAIGAEPAIDARASGT